MLLQLTLIFLNVLLPVFIVLAIGYVAGPRLGLKARTLTRYAYYILVPAFIFNIIYGADLEANLVGKMVVYTILVHIGCVILGGGLAWLLGHTRQMIGAYILIAVFGNVGNFGLPIIEFGLGPEALLPASIYFLIISTFAFIVGVAAANWYKGGSWGALLAIFKTPALIALLPALIFNWYQIQIPLAASRAVSLLAAAMVPTMLIALGVQLAGIGRLSLNKDVVLASAVRLVGGAILAIILALPLEMTGIVRGAGILQASMPAAVLASIIALEYDLVPDFVTTTVLFSTLASVVTLTVVLAIV